MACHPKEAIDAFLQASAGRRWRIIKHAYRRQRSPLTPAQPVRSSMHAGRRAYIHVRATSCWRACMHVIAGVRACRWSATAAACCTSATRSSCRRLRCTHDPWVRALAVALLRPKLLPSCKTEAATHVAQVLQLRFTSGLYRCCAFASYMRTSMLVVRPGLQHKRALYHRELEGPCLGTSAIIRSSPFCHEPPVQGAPCALTWLKQAHVHVCGTRRAGLAGKCPM